MTYSKQLLELVGTTAEVLVRNGGSCPVFAMAMTNAGEPIEVYPDTIEREGMDTLDRNSYFTYLRKLTTEIRVSAAAVVSQARVRLAPDAQEQDAIVIHLESPDVSSSVFIQPFSLATGSYQKDGDGFSQDAEQAIFG